MKNLGSERIPSMLPWLLTAAALLFALSNRPGASLSALRISGQGQLSASDSLSSAQPPQRRTLQLAPFPIRGPVAWECLNEELKRDYLLGGKVKLLHWALFNNDEYKHGAPVDYRASSLDVKWSADLVRSLVATVDRRNASEKVSPYGTQVGGYFYPAFGRHPVEGKDVLVVGSQHPWAEAMCLSFRAASVTTVDFNPPVIGPGVPALRSVNMTQLEAEGRLFDAIVSYSSLEHDGLGRYGDPLNPNGDIERMRLLADFLKPGGLLYLGIPLGADQLFWNAHRIYGPVRLQLLMAGWKKLSQFGEADMRAEGNWWQQPVMVFTPDKGPEM